MRDASFVRGRGENHEKKGDYLALLYWVRLTRRSKIVVYCSAGGDDDVAGRNYFGGLIRLPACLSRSAMRAAKLNPATTVCYVMWLVIMGGLF